MVRELWHKIFGRNINVVFKDISSSKVTVVQWFIRPRFKVKDDWINGLLRTSFDEEIKSKFIPELHQDHAFQRKELIDVLDFEKWKSGGLKSIHVLSNYIKDFEQIHADFYHALELEEIEIVKPNHPLIESSVSVKGTLPKLKQDLIQLKKNLSSGQQKLLLQKFSIKPISFPVHTALQIMRNIWSQLLSKQMSDDFLLQEFASSHDRLIIAIGNLNQWLTDFSFKMSCKIIAGNAGTGKTHMSAFLVREIIRNGEYVIFLKGRLFSGDNINFADRLVELLQLPRGLTLTDVLNTLNKFAKKKKKRFFIIFDALNETTTSSLGFSPIWHQELQSFINQLTLYSNLYFIATLRSSYLDSVWSERPRLIAELKGFNSHTDIIRACGLYFDYYKIKILTPNPDLSYFEVPLLLDLYCKLVNEKREFVVSTRLDVLSYKTIFDGYVSRLVDEVRRKRNLMSTKAIVTGLYESSSRFFDNIGAVLFLEEFVGAFDADDLVKEEHSIAKPILEGYLLFIRDKISPDTEIIKHTQQEVGGYLIARYLIEKFTNLNDLLASVDFKEKLIGANQSLHHQLRLDIIKFLIVSSPELIVHLNDKDSLSLAWWYLYNGFDGEQADVPQYLLKHDVSKTIAYQILVFGHKEWFSEDNGTNFLFIAELLASLEQWEFDMTWTFFVYNNYDKIFRMLEDSIKRLQTKKRVHPREFVYARFFAFVTATTIRELRDLSSVYLVEFGKLTPIALLELTEYCAKLKDKYIYERVVQCLYGVTLICQHDDNFVKVYLTEIAKRIFLLQFSADATAPVFNYIVIDSIKHILDLAILKQVWLNTKDNLHNISKYISPKLPKWIAPSKHQLQLIKNSSEMSWPEPIGMDFGIYTIPRLVDHGDYKLKRIAIANVYKRIFELGFKNSDELTFEDERFKDFYFGSPVERGGKVDKLGKKYNWNSFFDYAGVLLQSEKLECFAGENDPASGYERLSDVDIDISMPKKDFKINRRIYPGNLLEKRADSDDWFKENKIDSLSPYFIQEIDGERYVMLSGVVDQRLNDYKIRSFVMSESVLIKKNESFAALRDEVCKITFNWDRDIHMSPYTLTRSYFGEFYWADNQLEEARSNISVRTGKTILQKHVVDFSRRHQLGLSRDDVGKEVEKSYETFLSFESERTLIQYLWENDSQLLAGFGQNIPSVRLGKSLGLAADPLTGQILDKNLKPCLMSIFYRDAGFKNEFIYLRADLLEEYMKQHDLALLYQLKQHSYDLKSVHTRNMKYFVLDGI